MSTAMSDPAPQLDSHADQRLGTLAERAHEELSRLRLNAPLRFSFDWHGAKFTAQVTSDDGKRHVLCLQGDVAALPFTAENPSARATLINLLAQLSDDLASRFYISQQQRILCHGKMILTEPLNRATVIGGAATFLLALKPQLDAVLQECGQPVGAPFAWAASGLNWRGR